MNRFFNSLKTVAILFISTLILSSCNDDPGQSVCVIQVVDDAGNAVEGATVIVTATNYTTIIDKNNKVGELHSEEVTGKDGKSQHTFTEPGKNKPFSLEAVLEVRVSKVVANDTLIGRGSVHIYPDKVTNETVKIR